MTSLQTPQGNSTNGSGPRGARRVPPGAPAHRPRLEFFNLAHLSWTDHHGYVHPVERLHAEPWGLYMERIVDNPRYRYIESWLLPDLSLRATVYHLRPGHDRGQTYHLDIGDYGPVGPKRWRAEGHYLHVVARPGREPELLGIDELLTAHAAGYFDTAHTHRVIEQATRVVDGIAAHGHDVNRWFGARGLRLTWL